jgi:hypothetical protein
MIKNNGLFSVFAAKRMKDIGGMLPEKPCGFGSPCADRQEWEKPEIAQKMAGIVADAEAFMNSDFPGWDDDAYLDFSRTGKRPLGEAMQNRRADMLYPFVAAECLEDRGRFTDRINYMLNEFLLEKTWIIPAHDPLLDNFYEKVNEVDLRVSLFGHDLAQTLFLMGDKINIKTRQDVMAALEKRLFAPFRKSLETGEGCWWLNATHNWNSVCLAGVTGAALAVIEDKNDRAYFVAAAEHFGKNYTIGFPEDGYCLEGTGYWNYGFTSFITLRELLMQATSGTIDMFRDKKVRNIALYGQRIQMMNGQSPAFGDCKCGIRPDSRLVSYCNKALGLVMKVETNEKKKPVNIVYACMDAFTAPAKVDLKAEVIIEDPFRSYFKDSGVLVSRPANDSACKIAIVIKAGGNGNHSHNDIGSYVIQSGNDQAAGDPCGPQAYVKGMFNPEQRAGYELINSYGHPVPVVAGKLQIPSEGIDPKVLMTEFTPEEDTFRFDMAHVYNVPQIKKLVRTMKFSRAGKGSVLIEDDFEFSEPLSFETAIPTHLKCAESKPGVLTFSGASEVLEAKIYAPGTFEIKLEEVTGLEPYFTRAGIKLKEPVKSGKVSIVFTTVV